MMTAILANYVHDLSPILFEVGPLKLRWYGLAYVAGFLVGYWILLRLARRSLWVVPEEKVSDVVTFTAFFGVFLGGRIGYVLFYMLPEQGVSLLWQDPLVLLRVWDGGMASHGGILGIFFFTLYYAWRHRLSWPGLGDGIAVVAPLGIFFGRVANFINGELYGVKTESGFGVKFPASLREPSEIDQLEHAVYQAATVSEEVGGLLAQEGATPGGIFPQVVEISRDQPEVLEALAAHIDPRHASQLYEGFLEGALIFGLLYWLRVRFPQLGYGILTGIFFVLYALFRILVETVREPDSAQILGLTKGQFYSTFMILIGLGFLAYGATFGRRRREEDEGG